MWALQRVSSWAKLLALLLVYATGAVCFTRITTTAGPPMSPVEAAYHALRLFLVDAPGLPVEGPLPFRVGAWFAAFAAPIAAGGFLLDRVAAVTWQIVGSPPELLRFRGHAVVCGYGTHGEGIARWLATSGLAVVVVDHGRRGHGQWLRLRNAGDDLAPLIAGDMQQASILRLASADRAAVVVFATQDAMANLRAAMELQTLQESTWGGGVRDTRLLVLVDDPEPLELVVRALNAQRTRAGDIQLVSRFAIAEDLADEYLTRLPMGGRVVIVGLGRFGRALARRVAPRTDELVVIDRAVDTCLAEAGLDSATVVSIRTDAVAWSREPTHLAGTTAAFVCLDDDLANLQVATRLARRLEDQASALVVLRSVHPVMREVDRASMPHLQVRHTTALVETWFTHHGEALLRSPP